jgi:hypothetical protein
MGRLAVEIFWLSTTTKPETPRKMFNRYTDKDDE